MKDSLHFAAMLKERRISRQWVRRAESDPDRVEERTDGTKHFLKRIPEYENRWLRVVVNVTVTPHKRVTVFFDRSLRRTE